MTAIASDYGVYGIPGSRNHRNTIIFTDLTLIQGVDVITSADTELRPVKLAGDIPTSTNAIIGPGEARIGLPVRMYSGPYVDENGVTQQAYDVPILSAWASVPDGPNQANIRLAETTVQFYGDDTYLEPPPEVVTDGIQARIIAKSGGFNNADPPEEILSRFNASDVVVQHKALNAEAAWVPSDYENKLSGVVVANDDDVDTIDLPPIDGKYIITLTDADHVVPRPDDPQRIFDFGLRGGVLTERIDTGDGDYYYARVAKNLSQASTPTKVDDPPKEAKHVLYLSRGSGMPASKRHALVSQYDSRDIHPENPSDSNVRDYLTLVPPGQTVIQRVRIATAAFTFPRVAPGGRYKQFGGNDGPNHF